MSDNDKKNLDSNEIGCAIDIFRLLGLIGISAFGFMIIVTLLHC